MTALSGEIDLKMQINSRFYAREIMKKYIAKFEVEIEIKARNEKDANSLLQDIKFYKDSFGTKGEVRTIRSDLKSFYRADWFAIQ